MCYSALLKRNLDYLNASYGAIIVRDQVDLYLRAVAENPKRYPELRDRIFPGNYAPILFRSGDAIVLELMRYGAHPPAQIKDPQRYTTYNARRDNLKSTFWEQAFRRHHGFVVLESFFEWVTVKDLIAAGAVKIDAVRAEFARQIEERKQKVIAAQKPFKLTPTEKQEAIFRKIIIEFTSPDAGDLLAPVIFSEKVEVDGRLDRGFAIVTDEPSPEIAAAGHDRCPAFLSKSDMMEWIDPKNLGQTNELLSLLGSRPKLIFSHGIPKAA